MNTASDDRFKPKFRRTRTGCLRCRSGKHKCDEAKPVCKRCQNSSGECVYPTGTVQKQISACGTKRARCGAPRDSHRFEELDKDGQLVRRPGQRSTVSTATSRSAASREIPVLTRAVPTDCLTMTFPDVQERELMNHLLCFGTVVMHAIPKRNSPVPFLSVAQCLENPRGSSVEADAVLLSLISIAAAHQASLFLQREKRYVTSSPIGHYGTPAKPYINATADAAREKQVRMRAIGDQFCKASLELCRTQIVFKMGSEHETSTTAEMLLTSTVSTIIAQSLNGGKNWKGAYDAALSVIRLSGGQAKLLERCQTSPSRLLGIRTILEMLVIVDVCHCLASGAAPTFLTEPFAPWWFDHVPDQASSGDLDSLHYSYGMDRGMLELVNRVNILVHETQFLSQCPDPTYKEHHMQKVQDTLLELDIWESDTLKLLPNSRVQLGNFIMIHTMKVVIHVDLLHLPHLHPIVQAAASATLRYIEASWEAGYVIGLLLPTIITGSMMFDEAGRNRARTVLGKLRFTVAFAYDVEEAASSLENLFLMRDSGQNDPSWRLTTNTGLLLF